MVESIRVTTEDLCIKQTEWLDIVSQGEKAFLAAVNTAKKLEQCFSCRMARHMKTEFLAAGEEGEAAFEKLRGQLEKLSMIAALYDEAERSNIGVITDN